LLGKNEAEEDRGEFLEVGLGRSEDKEEEGELGQAIGSPRTILA
jgi:hypothetical protein